jgi:hypothetical protein
MVALFLWLFFYLYVCNFLNQLPRAYRVPSEALALAQARSY